MGMKKQPSWRYPDEKNARGFWLKEFENIKIKIDVPNILTFKTVQVELNGWIEMDTDYEPYEVERQIFYQKYSIKQLIRNWKQPLFKKESIIVVDTRLIPTRKSYQFYSMEVTHYVQPKMVYDKETIIHLLQPFYHNLIEDVFICNNILFKITRSSVMDNRKNVAKENKRKKLEQL